MKSRAHVKTAAFALAIAAGLCRLPVDAQPAGIEHVDFRDGTAFFSNEIHRLKSGRLAAPDKTDTVLWAAIEPPAFGYVAGYPSELAAILVHFGDRGGTGFFSELNLFSLREGKLVMIAVPVTAHEAALESSVSWKSVVPGAMNGPSAWMW